MRALGLDVGNKRIGIAISDPLRIIANPLEVYNRQGTNRDTDYLAKMIAEREATTVVVGLPLNEDGTDSEQTTKTRVFATALGQKTNAEIVFTDERCTTAEAEDMLIEADLSRADRKKVIDKVAAVIILQDYLNNIKR